MNLEAYKQASRDALEEVIERFAKIEQAADLQAGSLVQGLLSGLELTSSAVIEHIEYGYELKDVPDDWRERVKEALK